MFTTSKLFFKVTNGPKAAGIGTNTVFQNTPLPKIFPQTTVITTICKISLIVTNKFWKYLQKHLNYNTQTKLLDKNFNCDFVGYLLTNEVKKLCRPLKQKKTLIHRQQDRVKKQSDVYKEGPTLPSIQGRHTPVIHQTANFETEEHQFYIVVGPLNFIQLITRQYRKGITTHSGQKGI